VLAYYPDSSSPLWRSKVKVTWDKNVLSAAKPHPASVRMICLVAAVAPADERICWWARGDIGGGVQRGSELVSAASTKAVWSDLRLASLLTHLFCLFVCLLATLRKNFQTDLHEIFREHLQWASEQMIKF